MREYRQQRRRMRQARTLGLAEHHRLHAAEDRGESDASAASRIGVAQGCSRMAVVRIRNSLAKTPNGGMPRIASEPIISPQPTVGLDGDAGRGCRP